MGDNKGWCLTGLRLEPGPYWGNIRLMQGNKVLFEVGCGPGSCDAVYEHVFPEPVLVKPGRTLADLFTCDDGGDPLLCPDDSQAPAGAVFTIGVEAFDAP